MLCQYLNILIISHKVCSMFSIVFENSVANAKIENFAISLIQMVFGPKSKHKQQNKKQT